MRDKSREEWLEERRNCIGASDVAAILGANPYKGPLDVYAEKVLGFTQPDNKFMKYGRRMESMVAEMYQDETDREVLDLGATAITYHPDYEWFGVTLDRVTRGPENEGEGPLELKTVNTPYIKPTDWYTAPPLYYQIQLQAQIACLDAKWGSLAGLFPRLDLRWADHDRHGKLIDNMIPVLEKFWHENMLKKIPPPPTETARALDVVKAMYPDETGTEVEAGDEQEKLVKLWLENKSAYRASEKAIKDIEAQLRFFMKDATFMRLSDGTCVTLKKTHRKGYTRVVEASEYRTLRHSKKKGQ